MSDRKVHFSVPIHQIEYLGKQWETASRLARDGSSWLRMGLDRQRFQDRIERTAETLNRILDHEFRQKIYQERFENFVISDTQNITIYTNKPDESNINEYNQPSTSGSGTDLDVVADLKQQQHSIQAQCPQQHKNRQQNNRRRRSARKRNKSKCGRKHR